MTTATLTRTGPPAREPGEADYDELGGLSLRAYRQTWIAERRHPAEIAQERHRLAPIAAADGLFAWLLTDLYDAWSRAYSRTYGVSPDALRYHSPNEAERFWARTVPGPDGHVYWLGGKTFTTNKRRGIKPIRWAWTSANGPLSPTIDLWVACGDGACVNPDHLASGRVHRHRRHDREQALGRIRVLALAAGGTITRDRYDELKTAKDAGVFALETMLGVKGWTAICNAAGIRTTRAVHLATPDAARQALRELADHLGHPPSRTEYDRSRAWLKTRGLISSASTIYDQIGRPWTEALRQSGLA